MSLKNLFAYRMVRVLTWVLPVFVLVLIAIPARNYWVRRHKPSQKSSPLQRLPQELTALTQGFTLDRTNGSRKLFTIHAKSSEGYKDNKGMLDDVDVIIYGDTPDSPPKRVKSKECDYDQDSNDIHFYGDVQVELDPKTMAYTEDMIYNHVTGRIASGTRSRLVRQGSMTGEADRMEYNANSGLLQLWGNVQVRGDNGVALDSGSAVFQEKENWATVADGVFLRSTNGIVRGQTGRADLTPQTFQPRVVVIEGEVTAESAPTVAPADSWKMSAPWMQTFISNGRADKVLARKQVRAEKGSGDSKQVLTGQEVDATLDESGKVNWIEARTNARLVGAGQTLSSGKIQINASQHIETDGPSVLQTQDRVINGVHFIMQQGETLDTFETPNPSTIKSGASESSSDRATASFESRTNSLVTLNQEGHFQFADTDAGRRGHAQKATVTENGDVVRLEGSPVVTTSQMQLEAGIIELNKKNDSFVARQNVKTLTTSDSTTKDSQPERALITSEQAHGDATTVVYGGGVQLWRQTVYIRAAHLTVVSRPDQTHELHAEGNVRSNLGMVIASADKLDYDDTAQNAHYAGNVHSRKQDILTDSADMVVKMVDNQVSETVSTGKVTLTSPDHHGSGDRAVYDAKTNIVTLTGPNAQMTDPSRGFVRGPRIAMTISNGQLDKMIVESEGVNRAFSQQKVKN